MVSRIIGRSVAGRILDCLAGYTKSQLGVAIEDKEFTSGIGLIPVKWVYGPW